MSGEQDNKQYQRMLRHNLSKKALFDNNHAQQSLSSTYFLTDKITRDSVVLLNFRQSLSIIKNPYYLHKIGIPLKEITPDTVFVANEQVNNYLKLISLIFLDTWDLFRARFLFARAITRGTVCSNPCIREP